jgi:DHA3 family macrolide efflux protein-like MFS transporter
VIAIPQPVRSSSETESGKQASIWAELRAGFQYVGSWSGLVMLLLMAALINLLLKPAFALLPILVTKHFGGQAMQLAGLESAAGIGIVIGGLLLSIWGGFRRRIFTSLLGLIILGIGMAVIGLVPASGLWVAVVMVFLVGFSIPIIDGPILAIIQDVVTPEMQGRVLTLTVSVSAAMAPLGLVIAGPAADIFGVQRWYIICGILTLLLGLGALFVPAITQIEEDMGGETLPNSDTADIEKITGEEKSGIPLVDHGLAD